MTYRDYRKNPERSRKVMVPPDCAKRKLDGVVDSDKGCEVLAGELTHENGMKMTVRILLIVLITTFF